MTPLVVAGLDLSLASTGLAEIRWGDPDAPHSTNVTTRRLQSKGTADASLPDRHRRVHRLAGQIVEWAAGADLVVIEGPAPGAAASRGSHAHDRSGLWWIVVDLLVSEYSSVVVEVPPSNRCKYACGKGRADKDIVLAAVVRRYPDVEVTGNDVADALVLAAMGARHLGHPIEASLPQTHLDALTKIRWPERNPDQ